jgi:hypothetical protein
MRVLENPALPVHPTLRHPLTGEPLRAIAIRPNGKPLWPIMGGAPDDPPPNPAPPADPPAPKPGDNPPPDDDAAKGFPANTAVTDMTPEQQAAYWKHQSRKHEDRSKQFGDLTPEQLAEIRAKAERQDALEFEMASDQEKAVAEAKKAAKSEADAEWAPRLAETAFRVAIADRKTAEEISDFLGDLNLARFIKDDGVVDTAKVLARVEEFAPSGATPPPGTPPRRGPSPTGLGAGGGGGSDQGGAGGRAAAERMFPQLAAK